MTGRLEPTAPSLPPGLSVVPAPSALGAASTWPMLQLGDTPAASRRAWAGLPRLPWALSGRAKPGATVLATVASDSDSPLIAAQPFGLGRVIWVGTGETWRWRFRAGDLVHHRFWGQLIRSAATDRLAGGNDQIRFGPLRRRVATGETATFQARVFTPGFLDAKTLHARLVDARGMKPETRVALVPVAGRPRTYQGEAPRLSAGLYAVHLDLDVTGLASPLRPAALEVIEPSAARSERVELAAARAPLEQMADATGGSVVDETEFDRLLALLASQSRDRARFPTRPNAGPRMIVLWDQPATLILFLTLLTIEWVARKRLGLP